MTRLFYTCYSLLRVVSILTENESVAPGPSVPLPRTPFLHMDPQQPPSPLPKETPKVLVASAAASASTPHRHRSPSQLALSKITVSPQASPRSAAGSSSSASSSPSAADASPSGLHPKCPRCQNVDVVKLHHWPAYDAHVYQCAIPVHRASRESTSCLWTFVWKRRCLDLDVSCPICGYDRSHLLIERCNEVYGFRCMHCRSFR